MDEVTCECVREGVVDEPRLGKTVASSVDAILQDAKNAQVSDETDDTHHEKPEGERGQETVSFSGHAQTLKHEHGQQATGADAQRK